MMAYLARRAAQALLLLALITVAVFLVFQVLPGDVTATMVEEEMAPAARAALIERLGLNRPAHERLAVYVASLARLDLGTAFPTASFRGAQPVTEIVAERLPRTLLLFLAVVVVNHAIGVIAGRWLAWRRGSMAEFVPTAIGVVLHSTFTPLAGLILLWLLALTLGWFPFGGWQDFPRWRPFIQQGLTSNDVFVPMLATGSFVAAWILSLWQATREMDRVRGRRWARLGGLVVCTLGVVGWWWRAGLLGLATDVLWHMALPVLSLVLVGFARPMLIMRDAMVETMRDDFVLTARAKGLSDRHVRDRHVARAALLPIATSFALGVALTVDGAVITETLFSWPGMGQALMSSITERNYPVTMGVTLVTAGVVLAAHTVVDLLYAALDPRTRLGR